MADAADSNPNPRWLVSACLMGKACRYDGQSKGHTKVAAAVDAARARGIEVVAVCPEEAGGLPTPRPAADLRGGDGQAVLDGQARVMTHQGADVTAQFVAGAQASAHGCSRAILKQRSPSCGTHKTYIDGQLAHGDGVFAALLRQRGVSLCSEEELGDQDLGVPGSNSIGT